MPLKENIRQNSLLIELVHQPCAEDEKHHYDNLVAVSVEGAEHKAGEKPENDCDVCPPGIVAPLPQQPASYHPGQENHDIADEGARRQESDNDAEDYKS